MDRRYPSCDSDGRLRPLAATLLCVVGTDTVVSAEELVDFQSHPRIVDTRQPSMPLDQFLGRQPPPGRKGPQFRHLDAVARDVVRIARFHGVERSPP